MLTNEELDLLRLLPYGANNAVPTAYLSSITNTSQRNVRTIIRSLVIKHGVPIVGERTGSKRGYYIATNSEERTRAIAPLKAEIKRLAHRQVALEFAEIRTDWLEYLTKGDQNNGRSNF